MLRKMLKIGQSALVLVLLHLQLALTTSSESRYKFACELAQKVCNEHQNANVILSPASVQTCLALTYMGARGQTAEELQKALFLENFADKQAVAADYEAFLQAAIKSQSSKWHMANRIFVDSWYDIAPNFNEMATKYFHSKAEKVNFAKQQRAAERINDWIKSETNNRIQNLIEPAVLSQDTTAVLANAVYFRAEWQHKFDPTFTSSRMFRISTNAAKRVPMMYRTEMEIRYCAMRAYDMRVAELGYKDTDLHMLIMLPNKVNGLAELERQLNASIFQEVDKQLTNEVVNVLLPKFKIEFELSLVETLKSMGMRAIFSTAADLQDMLKTEKLINVSEVKHKAFIDVQESGSEAAAATYVQIDTRLERLKVIDFRVNRPFLFAIRDSTAIYFIGHVVDL